MYIAKFFLDIKVQGGVYINMFCASPLITKKLPGRLWHVNAVAEEEFY